MSKEKIAAVVLSAVREFNELREESAKISEDFNAVLFGPGGTVDSIGLVNLIVCVEEKCEDEFGQPVTIASEKAMSQKNSPFRSLQALADFVGELTVNPTS